MGKRTTRTNEDYNIFGRLKPGVTVAQAQAEVDRIVAGMKQQYPENYPPSSGFMISVVPLLQQVVGDVRRPLLILLGAVGFVLLICLRERREPSVGTGHDPTTRDCHSRCRGCRKTAHHSATVN